jgi:predicted AAA+ superfamily ATPase
MAPLTYAEANQQPISGVAQCIAQGTQLANFLTLSPPKDELQAIHQYWHRGGYPEPWVKDNGRFTRLWMQNYVKTYLERDILRLFPGIARQKYKLFLQMLSHLSGTIINYSDVARTLGISPPTARDYFEIAHGTFIWRKILPYAKNAQKRIIKHPKGYIRDPGLLHHLLHLTEQEDILSHPSLGQSWESMVIENLLRELSALGVSFEYYYYRTSGGAEVDLILEGDFGLVPIEIKHGQHVSPHSLRSLRDFVKERNCPYGLVINNDEKIRQYDEKIIGLPFGSNLATNDTKIHK